MDTPGPDFVATAGQMGLGMVPTFDIGFQSNDATQVQHALGQAAIATEKLYEGVGNALDSHLNQAQTNTSILQTDLIDKAYSGLNLAKLNTASMQDQLQASLAGQMGLPLDNTTTVAPANAFIRSINDPVSQRSGPVGTIQPPGFGVFPTGNVPPAPTQVTGPGGTGGNGVTGPTIIPGGPPGTYPPRMIGPPNSVCSGNNCAPSDGPAPDWLCASGGDVYGPNGEWISHIPPGIACGVPPNPGGSGYIPPVTPPQSGPGIPPSQPGPVTQPCPPCPTPTPPVPAKPGCITLCDTPKPKCDEPTYNMYCDVETNKPYIILDTDKPHSSNDTLLSSGTAGSLDLSQVSKCKKRETPPQTPPGGNAEQPANPIWQMGQLCNGLFNFNFLADPNELLTFTQIVERVAADPQNQEALQAGGIEGVINNAVYGILSTSAAVMDSLSSSIGNILAGGGCGNANVGGLVSARALIGLFGKFVGNAVEPLDTQLAYGINNQCPYRIITPDEALRQYLTDSISIDQLRCIVETNGVQWDVFYPSVDSTRSRLNPAETIMMWRRNLITKADTDTYLRQLGYIQPGEREALRKLSEQVPAVSDLMTMMMRDVEDDINIDWTSSDKLFADKWKGQIKEWGDFQGIPNDMAKYIWRAHWVIPSPTQLFEFWHRLRKSGQFGTEQQFYDKIKAALIQQDILPDWIDAYLQVSFKPLTRVDSKRAYQIGVLDEAGLKASFTDQGYDDTNADTMVEFTKKQVSLTALNSPVVKRYAAGDINRQELEDRLNSQGLPEQAVEQALERADSELDIATRKACVAAVKRQYFQGTFSASELGAQIASYVQDPKQAASLAKRWQCERSARGKQIPANTLCGWYERGVIDEVGLYNRLINLGYSQDNATAMVRDCMVRTNMKLDRKKQQAMQQAARQALQASRAEQALTDKLDKLTKEKDNDLKKAHTLSEQRSAKLLKAATAWSKNNGTPIPEASILIRRIYNYLNTSGIAPTNTIITAIENAAADGGIKTPDELNRSIVAMLEDFVVS